MNFFLRQMSKRKLFSHFTLSKKYVQYVLSVNYIGSKKSTMFHKWDNRNRFNRLHFFM